MLTLIGSAEKKEERRQNSLNENKTLKDVE